MIASTQTNHPLATITAVPSGSQALEEACAQLKKAGLRVTQPRIAILKALIGQIGPISIEQLHHSLSNTSCDLVTVYRCLAAFEEIGMVRRSFFHNGTSLYQLERAGGAGYHVINKADHSIRPLPAEAAAMLSETLSKIETHLSGLGYGDISHSVEFFASNAQSDTLPASITQRGLSAGIVPSK